jgi:hypothetical protein
MTFSQINVSKDTSLIWSFKADSLKFGRVIPLSGSSIFELCVSADDTNAAGYKSDSIKFDAGIRYGVQEVNSSTSTDTAWGPLIKIGRFSTLAADTAGKWISSAIMLSSDSIGTPVATWGYMDSTNVAGYAVTRGQVVVYGAANIVQTWVKGVTGNRVGGWIKVRTQIKQPIYLPVRNQ